MKSLVYFLFSDPCQVLKNLGTHKVLKAQEWTGLGQQSHDTPGKKTSSPDSSFDFCPTFVPTLSPVTLQRRSFNSPLDLQGFNPVCHGPSQQLSDTFMNNERGKGCK